MVSNVSIAPEELKMGANAEITQPQTVYMSMIVVCYILPVSYLRQLFSQYFHLLCFVALHCSTFLYASANEQN
jgi:hypothetical protein